MGLLVEISKVWFMHENYALEKWAKRNNWDNSSFGNWSEIWFVYIEHLYN